MAVWEITRSQQRAAKICSRRNHGTRLSGPFCVTYPELINNIIQRQGSRRGPKPEESFLYQESWPLGRIS
jgi:hypothetical protein